MSRRIKPNLQDLPSFAQVLATQTEGSIDDYAWYAISGTPIVRLQLEIMCILPEDHHDPLEWLHAAGYPADRGISYWWNPGERTVHWQPDLFKQVRFLVEQLGLSLPTEVRAIYAATSRVRATDQIRGRRRDTTA